MYITSWNPHTYSFDLEQGKTTIAVFLKKCDKSDCTLISLLPPTCKLSQYFNLKVNSTCRRIIGGHQCVFGRNRPTYDHIVCICQVLEKNWEYNGAVHKLFIDFEKTYVSVSREVLYNILAEFGISMKLVRIIKMFKWNVKSAWVKVCLEHLIFRMVWNEDLLYHCFFSALIYNIPLGRSKKMKDWNWMEYVSFWFVLTMLMYCVKT
jgi:hypothetical protein